MTASVSAPIIAVRRAVGTAALAAWLDASLQGGASPDDVADAAAAVGMGALRIDGQQRTLLEGLARLRSDGLRGVRLVLPAPGDVSGLPGPPALNRRLLQEGSALIITGAEPGAGVVLLPCGDDVFAATPSDLPQAVVASWVGLRVARADFAAAVAAHSRELANLDVAGDVHGLREQVLGEDEQPLPLLPPAFPAERRELLGRARLVAILAATAADDTGRAVSAAEATSRSGHLRALAGVARRALGAAVSTA